LIKAHKDTLVYLYVEDVHAIPLQHNNQVYL